jgi:hypothetical protein
MTKEQEEQEEPGFTVTDKRGFREDKEAESPDVTEKTAETVVTEEPPTKEEKPGDRASRERESGPRPPIDFPSYILSYYTQGMVLLGEIPNPYTNKREEDTGAAHHTIDILSMLEEKTRGNLSDEEKQLLETVLYELRMKFMAKTNQIKM